jgi:hypothetical protein
VEDSEQAGLPSAPKDTMARYRKKPVEIDAHQWFKNGDHPEDGPASREGLVVRYFRRPDMPGETPCRKCDQRMRIHGWIDTLEGGHIVCPGDWIITGIAGERYPCKPDIFAATYETPAKLYGIWLVDDLAKTGWVTAGGRVIVSEVPEALEGFMHGSEVRVYREPLPYSEWAPRKSECDPVAGGR